MRNIFLFIRRYFTFLTFLVLQVVSLWFLFTYNRFHRAKGLGVANEVTGWFNSKYNMAEDFLTMKEENRRVHKMNDSLMNLLSANFLKTDTTTLLVTDSVPFDTLGHYRQYLYRTAQVVYNTVNAEKNYFQINKGSKDGVADYMAVLGSDGSLAGTVLNVSQNFSVVMSLLHIQNKVSALMKRTGNAGNVFWDGKNPHLLTLTGIPKSDSISKGDTVITGNYSESIPPGKMVGTVAEISKDEATGFYVLRIKPAANFQTLQQVFVVENLRYKEQHALLEQTKKEIDNPKQTNR